MPDGMLPRLPAKHSMTIGRRNEEFWRALEKSATRVRIRKDGRNSWADGEKNPSDSQHTLHLFNLGRGGGGDDRLAGIPDVLLTTTPIYNLKAENLAGIPAHVRRNGEGELEFAHHRGDEWRAMAHVVETWGKKAAELIKKINRDLRPGDYRLMGSFTAVGSPLKMPKASPDHLRRIGSGIGAELLRLFSPNGLLQGASANPLRLGNADIKAIVKAINKGGAPIRAVTPVNLPGGPTHFLVTSEKFRLDE